MDVVCDLKVTDKREMLQILWLSYDQQKKHYLNWEHHLIDKGFGQEPRDGKERELHGNVVFFESSQRRMLHIDEMGFSFDGSKNGLGGRVAKVFSNPLIPDAGQADQKSGDKVSILFGANYEGETIPPMIVFLSKAKQPKAKMRMLEALHQIKGKFGYSHKHTFNCVISYSENGSVTKEIYSKWYQEVVSVLYPDIADVPGTRVLVKSDGGPGRTDPSYLARSNLDGLVHYPGLPNGTLFQELDQIFHRTKSITENNRKRIFNSLFTIFGRKARVEFEQIGYILFGGKLPLRCGSSLVLENAYELSMDPEHLKAAQAKCGYVPANRAALHSGKLRREIVHDQHGNINEELNDMIIAQNIACASWGGGARLVVLGG